MKTYLVTSLAHGILLIHSLTFRQFEIPSVQQSDYWVSTVLYLVVSITVTLSISKYNIWSNKSNTKNKAFYECSLKYSTKKILSVTVQPTSRFCNLFSQWQAYFKGCPILLDKQSILLMAAWLSRTKMSLSGSYECLQDKTLTGPIWCLLTSPNRCKVWVAVRSSDKNTDELFRFNFVNLLTVALL